MHPITYCFYGLKLYSDDNVNIWEMEETLDENFKLIYLELDDDTVFYLTHEKLCWEFSSAYDYYDHTFINISEHFSFAEYMEPLLMEQALKSQVGFFNGNWIFATAVL